MKQRMITVPRSVLLALVGVMLGSLIGAVALAVHAAESGSDRADKPTEAPASPDTTPSYQSNPRGQTVGEQQLGAVPPDLVEATTDDGIPTYVYYSDLYPSQPADPAEAVRQTRQLVRADGTIVVPAYAFDGVTRLGEVTVGDVVDDSPSGAAP
jgi:hypothetical protein